MGESDPVQYWIDAANAASTAVDGGAQTTALTATTNAIQGMSPNTGGAGSFSDYWQGLLKTGVQYAIQKDAVRNGVAMPVGAAPGTPYVQVQSGGAFTLTPGMLMIGVIAVAAYLALRK